MTVEALGGRADRLGEVERWPERCVAFAAHFADAGIVSETFDDVGLPVGGAIARIGGIERGLAVSVIRMARMQAQELLGRRVERDALRQELRLHLRMQEWCNLAGGVVSRSERAVDHELRFGAHILLGVALEQRTRGESCNGCTQPEDRNQCQIDPQQQPHAIPGTQSSGSPWRGAIPTGIVPSQRRPHNDHRAMYASLTTTVIRRSRHQRGQEAHGR